MRITEFKKITASMLNESLAKKYGKKINLESFTLEQLQDVRNRIRTKLSQFETNESYNAVQNETYQKSKLMLDVLNAEINERAHVAEAVDDCDETCPKSCPDCGGTGKAKTDDKKVDEGKPDFLDLDKDGDKEEPMKKAAKDAKKKKVDEGKDIIGNYFTTLLEGAEDHAELVMAAKDMVDRLTGWMEDTAEMQSESMLELADAIRDEMGAEQADQFTNTVKPALEAMYATMETTRVSLTQGVGQITGEAEPADMMGADDDAAMPMDDAEADMEMPVDGDIDMDDFAADGAAAGGDEEAARAKRESRMNKKRAMLEQSRRLGAILSKKK
jgi:hypothetical protein